MPGADAQRSDPRVLGQLNSSITLSEELKITADKKVTTAKSKGFSDVPRADAKRSDPRVLGSSVTLAGAG